MHIRLLLAATALVATAAPADAKVYVGEPVDGCGAGAVCRGPSRLLYKPKTLALWPAGAGSGEAAPITVRKLRWKRWGKPVATGHGTARVGDSDNGYRTGRVTVRLSKIVAAGCSDESGRFRAYSRARLNAKSLGWPQPLAFTTLGC